MTAEGRRGDRRLRIVEREGDRRMVERGDRMMEEKKVEGTWKRKEKGKRQKDGLERKKARGRRMMKR